MRNIEIKCRCEDLDAVRTRAEALGARDAGVLRQTDTFFPAPGARLKLRDFGDGTAELIGYRRPDEAGARGSDYRLFPTTDAAGLESTLAHALGISGVVRKVRHLFLLEHTRIHLDEVEGLGSFVELETVMSGQTEAQANEELNRILRGLNLEACEPIAGAYFDLLEVTKSC